MVQRISNLGGRVTMVTALDDSNFDATVLDGDIVLIDCWASWCRGCKDFAPIFEAASERHPAHTFATLDTQAEGALTARLGVSHVPTLILFRDGILLLRQPGYVPPEGLDEIVGQAESLDMDEVRAGIDKDAAESTETGE